MPIRWYGPANPKDPTYRHFSRVVNLIIHMMVFAAINSGLWFFELMHHRWDYLNLFTELWLLVFAIHFGVVVFLRPAAESAKAIESE